MSALTPKGRQNAESAKFAQKRAEPTLAGDSLSQYVGRLLNESAQVEAVPHVPKRQAHQRLLENWSHLRRGLFQRNRPDADTYLQQGDPYSITSSARAIRFGGRVRPIAPAALRLTDRVNLSGACTGSSPGLTPRRV